MLDKSSFLVVFYDDICIEIDFQYTSNMEGNIKYPILCFHLKIISKDFPGIPFHFHFVCIFNLLKRKSEREISVSMLQ